MRTSRRSFHAIATTGLVIGLTACGGGSDDASSSADDDAATPVTQTDGDGEAATPEPVEGNASITLDGQTYGFDTEKCDIQAIDGESATGVITLDGQPTFVEIRAFGGDGIISLNVGLSSDTAPGETMEETLARGATGVWNLFFEMDDLSAFSDTEVVGTETFQKVMSLDGSSGTEVPGGFAVDCS